MIAISLLFCMSGARRERRNVGRTEKVAFKHHACVCACLRVRVCVVFCLRDVEMCVSWGCDSEDRAGRDCPPFTILLSNKPIRLKEAI